MYMLREKKTGKSLSVAVRKYYLIFNTLLILVFGVSVIGISMKMLIKKVEETNEIITEHAGASLDQTISTIVNQMVNFSSHRDLLNQLNKRELTMQEQLDLERELGTILKKADVFNSVVQDIFVIGDNGFVFSTVTRSGLAAGYDYWGQEWYQKARDTSGNVFVRMLGLHPQDYYSSSMSVTAAKKTFSVSYALRNPKGNAIGALIYNFDLTRIAEILSSGGHEKDGKIAVLDEEGRIISQSDNEQIGTVLPVSQEDAARMREEKEGRFQALIGGKNHLVSFRTTFMGMKLVSYIPWWKLWEQTSAMVILLVMAMGICLAINLLIAVQITRSIQKPIRRMTENIQKVDFEHLSLEAEGYGYRELNQTAEKFNELLNRLDVLIQKDYKSQILLNKFRLYSLQSQINPHFLMNTLQQLQTEIIYGNVENSNEIVVSLSKMLRYSLYNYEAIVPIPMELQYIRSYLNLFSQKFDGELRAEYEIDPSAEAYCMPKMLLQPVVENCITHAFQENPHGAVIKIEVTEAEDGFCFCVEDNGQGMSGERLAQVLEDLNLPEIDNDSIGIRNIHQRIRLLFGERYGVEITSEEKQGTRFLIKIPKISSQERRAGVQCGGDYETLNYR